MSFHQKMPRFISFVYDIVGNDQEFQRLLKSGVDLNAKDDNGNSALSLAAKRGK